MNKLKKMMVGVLAVAGAWCAQAAQTPIPYLSPVFDAKGAVTGYETKYCTAYQLVENETIEGPFNSDAEWVVFKGDCSYRVIDSGIKRAQNYILLDGCVVTCNGSGMQIYKYQPTIYAQSTDPNTMGCMILTGSYTVSYSIAGICCKSVGITINGGKITATGGSDDFDSGAAGIGLDETSRDPNNYWCANVTINGGIITARGGVGAAGIGGSEGYVGSVGNCKDVKINGGTVYAYGGKGGAGIGGGDLGMAERITINGGTVYAEGGKYGAGIGGGGDSGETGGLGRNITINGGAVTAVGGAYAAGIGGGNRANGSNITINGGTVTAEGKDSGSGIGGGDGGTTENITISGGSVKATSEDGAAIGCTPKNASSAMVFMTTVTGVEESPAQIEGLANYGVNDLYPDNGSLYLYLPIGIYSFHSSSKKYSGSTGTVIAPSGEYYGITVNGTNLDAGSGTGWSFADNILTLSAARDYTLAGSETVGRLRVQVTANATVTLDGLTLPVAKDSPGIAFSSAASDAKLVLKGDNTVYAQNDYPAVDIQPGAKVTLSGDGALAGGKSAGLKSRGVYNNGTFVMNGGTINGYWTSAAGGALFNNGTAKIFGGTIRDNKADVYGGFCFCSTGCRTDIYGGIFSGNTAQAAQKCNLYCGQDRQHNGRLYGGVFAADPTSEAESSDGKSGSCLELQDGARVTTLSGASGLSVVGKDVKQNSGAELTGGIYTFCPTNAAYEAVGLAVEDGTWVTKRATTPVTWVLGVVYPDYLAGWGAAVTNTFETWAKAYPPGDPDGIYTNAYLLNVAQNREAEAVAAFKIASIAVTNEVVYIGRAKPLAPAKSFNGTTWLQCATDGLSDADFLDIEDGRYTESGKSFFIQRIDFDHTLTPEAFPTKSEGSKTMRVTVNTP